MRILITGGAGFVGSALAREFKKANLANEVVAFDNLKRRGSELNLSLFLKEGITFVHGDVRSSSDLASLTGDFDCFLECAAEPSVLAGLTGSPNYALETNLTGTLNCLEFARHRAKQFIFLSTSRVYSIGPLREIQLTELETRFEIAPTQLLPGIGTKGITENFITSQPRSLYGMTKLASEMAVQEYVELYGMEAIINRCGVIAGPGQFGKVDQGVFTLWVVNHLLERPLRYTGFGGTGKQVRDLLHPKDLFSLLQKQLPLLAKNKGGIFNVGGGREASVSLLEMTRLCQEIVGKKVPLSFQKESASVDIPLYLADCSKAEKEFGWRPECRLERIIEDITRWAKDNRPALESIFS